MEPERCAICLEALGEPDCLRLACGHRFHGCCVAQWFRMRSKACPVCRDAPAAPSSDEDLLSSDESEALDMTEMLSAACRSARLRSAPAALAAAGRRHAAAKRDEQQARRDLREHMRAAHGAFPVLRATARALEKRAQRRRDRVASTARALLRVYFGGDFQ